jgi:hypothetical protein
MYRDGQEKQGKHRKSVKKEGGEDKIKLGLHREMKVVTETHSISDMARMDKGTTS